MRYNYLGLALSVYSPTALVRAVSTVTIRVPTGTCAPGSGSSTVIVFSTTDSQGSTYVTSTTSTISMPPSVRTSGTVSSSVVAYSTTDSKGSTYVTSTTSTTSIPPSTPTSTGNPSTAPFPCPDYEGKNYIDATGAAYGIDCATSYPGSDLITSYTGSMEACIAACDNYVPSSNVAGGKPCVGGTWSAGNTGGDCSLKYAITTKQYGVSGETSFFKYGYIVPSSSGESTPGGSLTSTPAAQSTSAPGPVSTDGTCGAANGNTVCGNVTEGLCCSQYGVSISCFL